MSTTQSETLIAIGKAIDKSKYILDLEDDWDDEGSPAYKEDTWSRATTWLHCFAMRMEIQEGVCVPPPRIYHSSQGSIDILWEESKFRMLANVPARQDKPMDYYIDDRNGIEDKGYWEGEETDRKLLKFFKPGKEVTPSTQS